MGRRYDSGMQQIDMEPGSYRRGPIRQHPLTSKVFKRAASLAAVWFMLVVTFGRIVVHDMPWWVIALPAVAPAFLLAYIVISLDD